LTQVAARSDLLAGEVDFLATSTRPALQIKKFTFTTAMENRIGAWVRLAFIVGTLLPVAAATAQPLERPVYKKLRYEEDWSVLRDPARRMDPLDAVKYIPLDESDSAFASLGGELRERYEYAHNPAWGSDPQDKHGVFLQRYAIHGDIHVGPQVRFFAQLFSALENGRAGGTNTLDENELDLQQAFLDLSSAGSDPGRGTTLRLGRQEMLYGSSRLIDVREGPNVRRKFDGGRLLLDLYGWQVDAIAVRPSKLRTGVFDDAIDRSQALWGVYGVRGPGWLPLGAIDLYYLGYRSESGSYEQGAAEETRHTFGARLWGEAGAWDWNWEFIYQAGRFGNGDIRAWSLASDTGYTWRNARFTPRLGISANVASGDRDPKDRHLQTFNPLFPRGNYFSEIALLGPRNFYNIHPFLSILPWPGVVVTTDVDFFWRFETGDGVYGPGGQLLRSGSGSDARYVATELSLNVTYQMDPRASVSAIYAHSFPGQFIRDTGPSKDIDYVEFTLKVLF